MLYYYFVIYIIIQIASYKNFKSVGGNPTDFKKNIK